MTKIGEQLLLTPEQAAELLGVGRTTLYGLLSSGQLPSVNIGRFRRVHRDELTTFANSLVTQSVRCHERQTPLLRRRAVPRGNVLGCRAEGHTAEECCRFLERS
jgi:excisionase family DNA binding protein